MAVAVTVVARRREIKKKSLIEAKDSWSKKQKQGRNSNLASTVSRGAICIHGFDLSAIPLTFTALMPLSSSVSLLFHEAVWGVHRVQRVPVGLEDSLITDMKTEGRDGKESSALHRRYTHNALIITSEASWEGLPMMCMCVGGVCVLDCE